MTSYSDFRQIIIDIMKKLNVSMETAVLIFIIIFLVGFIVKKNCCLRIKMKKKKEIIFIQNVIYWLQNACNHCLLNISQI